MYLSLQNLAFTNFRGIHKPLMLDFTKLPPGLYFVRGFNEAGKRLGGNGAGKSTIFIDGPIWATTGSVARKQRPGADIVNWDNVKQKTGVVYGLKFDDVLRQIERTRNPNSLKLDGDVVEQRRIDEILPLTDAALRRSILIDQFGEMFLSLAPEKKAVIFSETLGLDTWLAAADRAGDKIDQIEEDLAGWRESIAGTESALLETRAEFQAAEKAEAGFEEDTKRQITEARGRRSTAEEEAEKARKALDTARAELAAVGKADAVVALNELRAGRRRLQTGLASGEALVVSAGREIEKLQKRLKEYSDDPETCPECGQKVSKKHVAVQRRKLEGDIEALTAEKVKLERRVRAAQGDLEEVDQIIEKDESALANFNAKQDIVSARAETSIAADRALHRIEDEIDELRKKENPFTAQCDRLDKRIKQLRKERKEAEAKINAAEDELEIYKFWQKGFREIRLQQIDSTLLELEMATNRHAEELGLEDWEIGFATEREKKSGGISTGFSVFLYPPGQKEAIPWESYSGGESQRWQLATTFGLAEILLARSGIGTDFEVLDEPTIHLSPEGIDDLLVCLRDRAADLNRRIFVIDHHALDRGAFDGVLTVVKSKKDGVYIENSGIAPLLLSVSKKERARLDD